MPELSPSVEDNVVVSPIFHLWPELFSSRDLKAAISQLELERRLSYISTGLMDELSQLLKTICPVSQFLDGDCLLLDLETGTLPLLSELRTSYRDSFSKLQRLLNALRQSYGSTDIDAEILRLSAVLRAKFPFLLVTRSPTATSPPDLSSTRIESDFCSSIVTVQRMSPLRLFKIRWSLESIIFPNS